jgi:hypothetical protein
MTSLAIATYSEFEMTIVNGSGIEQVDANIADPVGNKLLAGFRHISGTSCKT